jgi:hypothetical protein
MPAAEERGDEMFVFSYGHRINQPFDQQCDAGMRIGPKIFGGGRFWAASSFECEEGRGGIEKKK